MTRAAHHPTAKLVATPPSSASGDLFQQMLSEISEPAHNIAAQLQCARHVVMGMEDDTQDTDAASELHAVQRILAMCIEQVEQIAEFGMSLPTQRSAS